MEVNEQEREQSILDAATDLLCRFGYNKLTMGDVADAVTLHRGLVYLRFKSKDELVEAVVFRELDRYAEAWREHLESDPRGGTMASVYRAMVDALKTLPLASAVVARDEQIFGKYLRKPGNLFARLSHGVGTLELLRTMQDADAIRRDVDIRALAFILDALIPAIRRTFPVHRDADVPTSDEVMETLAGMLDALSPVEEADLAAGKAVLLSGLERARADFEKERRGKSKRRATSAGTPAAENAGDRPE